MIKYNNLRLGGNTAKKFKFSLISALQISGRTQAAAGSLRTARQGIKAASAVLEKRINNIKEAAKDMDLKKTNRSGTSSRKTVRTQKTARRKRPAQLKGIEISLAELLGPDWWRKDASSYPFTDEMSGQSPAGASTGAGTSSQYSSGGLGGYGLHLI